MKKSLYLLLVPFIAGCSSDNIPSEIATTTSVSSNTEKGASAVSIISEATDNQDWKARFIADPRKEFYDDEDGEPQKNYSETWSNASASEWIEFIEPEFGIKLLLPYNPIWGSPTWKVHPYLTWKDDSSDPIYVQFGPAIPGEGGLVRRDWLLTISKPKEFEDVLENYKKMQTSDNNHNDELYPHTSPEYRDVLATLKINNLDVIRYSSTGQSDTDTYIILHPKGLINISHYKTTDSRATIEQTIQSIR